MRDLDGELIFSPSDLTGFAACGHLTNLELSAVRGEVVRPTREDPFIDVLTTRGFAHEEAMTQRYRDAGLEVVDLSEDFLDDDGKRRPPTRAELEELASRTVDAMRAGVDVIAQGAFFHDGWTGYADFIVRVDPSTSDLGAWSYEVADAKLARRAKPGALVQLCVYSEHVARIQGVMPEHLHVLTGDGGSEKWRIDDALAYTRTLRERFDEAIASPVDTYPEKVGHCDVCRWADECADRRRTDDHLSLVAKIRNGQIERLRTAGITTRGALAALDAVPVVDGIGEDTLESLHRQARLQVAGDGAERPLYELLEPPTPPARTDGSDGGDAAKGAKLGFAALATPSPGDLFVDFEGDPFAGDPTTGNTGLEYLFGVVDLVEGPDGRPRFRSFWAHDAAQEQAAFEAFIDLIVEAREADPDLHVYHYASYEQTALKRLMGRYATREVELDDLLRNDVFVDLYQVVRQAVRLSTESYGLKSVERLYLDRSGDDMTGAVESIVFYEEWLAEGRSDASKLATIEEYNRRDCESLVGLRAWLEERRVEAAATFGTAAPVAVVGDADEEMSASLAAWEARRARLEAALTAGLPTEDRTPEQVGRWLLAQLLGWHRREDKPEYWRYYERAHDYDADQFLDDTECIGGLTHDRYLRNEKKSALDRYEFPIQEHKVKVGDTMHDPATEKSAGSVFELGDDFLVLKRGRSLGDATEVEALIPGPPAPTTSLREAIASVADAVLDPDVEGAGDYAAAWALLCQEPPRGDDLVAGAPLVRPGEETLDAAKRLALDLDCSYLPIQGPPGSGKTFTGAHMIVSALDAGFSVGVSANSHAVITNLLDKVCEIADERDVTFRGLQKYSDETNLVCADGRVTTTTDNRMVEEALQNFEVDLVGATAWFWSREGMRSTVDLLVVDEAGQMSLANTVAVATATSSLVLLGDPQQLAQPSKGSHPPGSEVSALKHVLGEERTMPDERGLFLDTTYRMHPTIAKFISDIAYEGRLASATGCELQAVDGFSGLRFVEVEHTGNRVRSTEEAAVVADLVHSMVRVPTVNAKGRTTTLALDDIIVISPYNAQVTELHRALPDGTRVGTVDKFQGREGVVAIYSMASSTAEDAPRGINFLYDLNRLNVAVSRAKAVAIVVASPELLEVLCTRADQVPRVNALCSFVRSALGNGSA